MALGQGGVRDDRDRWTLGGFFSGDIPRVDQAGDVVDVFGVHEADMDVEEEVVGAVLDAVAVGFDDFAEVAVVNVIVVVAGDFFAHQDDIGRGEAAEVFGGVLDVIVGEVV